MTAAGLGNRSIVPTSAAGVKPFRRLVRQMNHREHGAARGMKETWLFLLLLISQWSPCSPWFTFFQVSAANEPRGTPRGRAATTAGRPCLCPVGTLENSPAIYRWDSISERQASRRDARGATPPVDSTVPPGRCILCRFYPSDKSLGYFQTPLTGRQRS
jgi:hypothetical protein